MVCVYDDILQLYGDNNANINYAPINQADVVNAHKQNESIHYDVLRNHNLTGAGILSGLTNLLSHGKKLYPMVHGAYNSKLGKNIRNSIKSVLKETGHPQLASALKSIGFGGKMAPHGRMSSSLLE